MYSENDLLLLYGMLPATHALFSVLSTQNSLHFMLPAISAFVDHSFAEFGAPLLSSAIDSLRKRIWIVLCRIFDANVTNKASGICS